MRERRRPAIALIALTLTIALAAATAAAQVQPRVIDPTPCLSLCEPPPKVEPPDPNHSIILFNVGWDTGNPNTSKKLVPTDLPYFANLLRTDLNTFLRDSSAPLPFHDWQVTEGGSFMIPPPLAATSPATCKGYAQEIVGNATTVAAARGIDASPYTLTVVHFVGGLCEGSGGVSGRQMVLSFGGQTIPHEFGHFYGLDHANFLSCSDGAGNQVPLSNSCAVIEYGDTYDVMGEHGFGTYNAVYAHRLGWLTGEYFNLKAGDLSRTYVLRPYSAPAHVERAIRLEDGATTLWLEYRQPIGTDAFGYLNGLWGVEPGLVIHREVILPNGASTSQLLDMTPATPTSDSALPVGQTWANPLGEMKIRLDSANSGAATVTISSQRVTVPDVVDSLRKPAIAALEAAGLHYTGLKTRFDASCDYIGKVMEQSPPAGSRVFPGTAASITEGVEDKSRPCN